MCVLVLINSLFLGDGFGVDFFLTHDGYIVVVEHRQCFSLFLLHKDLFE